MKFFKMLEYAQTISLGLRYFQKEFKLLYSDHTSSYVRS